MGWIVDGARFWGTLAAQTLARGPVAMRAAARGDMRTVEANQVGWAEAQLRALRCQLHVSGTQHAVGGRPYVVIANHVSNLDPVVLFAALPIGMTYVAKSELLRVPVFGPIIARTGAVFVDRGNSRQAREAMRVAAERVRAGQSVLVFAEGTRSRDGRLKAFKKGGFLLAQHADVPILPVVLHGTATILPYGARIPRPGCAVHVTILPPVLPDGRDHESVLAEVHAAMAAALASGPASAD